MESLPTADFSENQKKIIQYRVENKSYTEIQRLMSISTGHAVYAHHISLCLMRSALGYSWDFGTESGNHPYLCKADLRELTDIVTQAHEDGAALDTIEVIDEATKLKESRMVKGLLFLKSIHSLELAKKLADQTVFTPSRSWLNTILNDLDAHIRTRRLVDAKRLEATSYRVIDAFFITLSGIIHRINPTLLFTVDETMLETSIKNKVVVRAGVKEVVEEGYPNMQHITGMMCCNIYGQGPPPLVILSGLRSMPDELRMFNATDELWLGSTSSGYMTKDMFVYWTLCFINWLSKFRCSLPPDLREAEALIILDGHTSRENPLAMCLMRKAHVNVLVLPSHTTHVLQIFDVSIAGPLKRFFSQFFKKELKKAANDDRFQSNTARYRYACIMAFLSAWKAAATPINCLSGAKATGIYPFDQMAPRASIFVRDLLPHEQARFDQREARNANRLNINGKFITDAQFIVEMAQQIVLSTKFPHLCAISSYASSNYTEIIESFKRKASSSSILLTSLPPLFSPNSSPKFFE